MFRKATSKDMLKTVLAEHSLHYVNHRIYKGGEMKYFQMKIVRSGTWGKNRGIVLGIRSVD